MRSLPQPDPTARVGSQQQPRAQLVEIPAKTAKKRVQAYHIAPKVRALIADEFVMVGSTDSLARKYSMSIHTITDCVLLALRKAPQSERLSPIQVFARRTA